MLKKNTGIVILVGIAARLVTTGNAIAISAAINSAKFAPNSTIANKVMGVNAQH